MAKEAKKDEVLGVIKGKMPIYKNGLDVSGHIIMCEEGIIIADGENNLKAPFQYVKMLEKASDLPLGKISVEMDVYDQMGQKHYFQFGMSDQHFNALKKACSK